MKEKMILLKMSQTQEKSANELAHMFPKKIERIFRSKVQNLTRVFKYLHDSNSISRLARINSE